MGPSYMWSVVDQNIMMQHMTVKTLNIHMSCMYTIYKHNICKYVYAYVK